MLEIRCPAHKTARVTEKKDDDIELSRDRTLLQNCRLFAVPQSDALQNYFTDWFPRNTKTCFNNAVPIRWKLWGNVRSPFTISKPKYSDTACPFEAFRTHLSCHELDFHFSVSMTLKLWRWNKISQQIDLQKLRSQLNYFYLPNKFAIPDDNNASFSITKNLCSYIFTASEEKLKHWSSRGNCFKNYHTLGV